MKIIRLEINNFFSVKHIVLGKDVFKPGTLNLVIGKNGEGKSTIFSESISWCLFGQTDRGKGKDEVINETVGKDCCVEIVLRENKKYYRIKRFRKHAEHGDDIQILIPEIIKDNKVKKWTDIAAKDNKEANIQIQEIIGSDFLSFQNSFMFSQQNTKFFSGCTDGEQKQIVERVAGLEDYTQYHKIANRKKIEAENKIDHLGETVLVMLEERLENIKDKITLEQEESDNFAKEKQEIKHSLEKCEKENRVALAGKKAKKKHWKKLYNKASNKTEELDGEIQELDEKICELKDKKTVVDKQCGIVNSQRSTQKNIARKLESKINKIKDSKTGVMCNQCGSTVTKKSLKSLVQEPEEQLITTMDTVNNLDKEEIKLNKKIEKLKAGINVYKEQKNKLVIKYNEMDDKVEKITEVLDKTKDQIYSLEKEQTTLQVKLEELGKKRNPHALLIKELNKQAKKIKSDIKDKEEELEQLKTDVKHYKFIKKMFSPSGIRSMILKSVTPYLNNKIEEYLPEEVKVIFHTQTQLKNKEMREKFRVEIVSKVGSKLYQQRSGGQKNIIDMPVLMTLCSLAQCRGNSRFNFLVFDELFKVLDDENLERTLELLDSERHTRDGIFIISHNKDLMEIGDFDNIFEISDGEMTVL